MAENNGLYYMRARYYYPEIKAFINEDTVIGNVADTLSLNRYAYGKGNPLSYIDPSGYEGINSNNYDNAKADLWDAVYKQYPLARLRFIKKNSIENVLINYKNSINQSSARYGVPAEIIAGIIVKEQITQSLPDSVGLLHSIFNPDKQHSVGLGAIFPRTAKKAWYQVDMAGAYINGIYGTNAEIMLRLIMDDEASINTIAVVLKYYATLKYAGTSNLSMEQWKIIVGRYNATDSNPQAQKQYSDYVFDYIDPLKTMLK